MKISVIVPAYNSQRFIDKCIEALLNQTIKPENYEVIIVDDGSTDGTGDIVKGYPVNYIRQNNSGPATARNKGAKKAKGDIILFTDSDCVAETNWIEEMAKPFEDTEVVAVKGAYRTNQNSIVAMFVQLEFGERFEMLKKVESIDMVDTYSAGYRKRTFLQLSGFDVSFPVANNEDTELSYRMSKLGFRMVFNPNAVVYHLNHPDSIKKYARLKFWRGYWRMAVYRKFPGKIVKDTYTPQTLKLQILFLYSSLMMLLFMWLLPELTHLFFLSIVVFVLLTLPLTTFALKRNTIVGILTPFFLFVRAASLGAGIIYGILSNFKKFTH